MLQVDELSFRWVAPLMNSINCPFDESPDSTNHTFYWLSSSCNFWNNYFSKFSKKSSDFSWSQYESMTCTRLVCTATNFRMTGHVTCSPGNRVSTPRWKVSDVTGGGATRDHAIVRSPAQKNEAPFGKKSGPIEIKNGGISFKIISRNFANKKKRAKPAEPGRAGSTNSARSHKKTSHRSGPGSAGLLVKQFDCYSIGCTRSGWLLALARSDGKRLQRSPQRSVATN